MLHYLLTAADVVWNTCGIHFALRATHVLGSRLFCWQFWEHCGYNIAPILVAPSEKGTVCDQTALAIPFH